jgi:hypothetical protein
VLVQLVAMPLAILAETVDLGSLLQLLELLSLELVVVEVAVLEAVELPYTAAELVLTLATLEPQILVVVVVLGTLATVATVALVLLYLDTHPKNL